MVRSNWFDKIDVILIIWAVYNKILDSLLTIYGVSIGMKEFGIGTVYLLKYFDLLSAVLINLMIYIIGLLMSFVIVVYFTEMISNMAIRYRWLIRKAVPLFLVSLSSISVIYNILQLLEAIHFINYKLSQMIMSSSP